MCVSLERMVDIMRYYDIHINYDGTKDGAGYSIFVKANVSSEDEVLQYAIDNHLFEEDGDEKGGGRGGKEEDAEKEEPPVAIPMIGDTKTGPLSLIAGQDNHRREPVKKTRVGRESSRR